MLFAISIDFVLFQSFENLLNEVFLCFSVTKMAKNTPINNSLVTKQNRYKNVFKQFTEHLVHS